MSRKDPNHTAQLPLPAVPGEGGAQLLSLPLPERVRPEAEPRRHGRPGLWYALYFPQLAGLPDSRQQEVLNGLAGVAGDISASISLHPQALVCELRSSLRYFGGPNNIHARLRPALEARLLEEGLEPCLLYAACPTIAGSLLLARSGHNALVYRRENLRSALGRLSIEVLHLDREQARRLHNMGLRYLRDIWRLPISGLRKRFGSDFVNQLNRALGQAPEPTRNYLPPPSYSSACELPYELENLDRLLPVVDEMLAALCDFLRRRDLSSSQLQFTLVHENREGSRIDLALRQPSRSRSHLLLLLETHFSSLTVPAPIVAVRLSVKAFDAFMADSESLLVNQASCVQAGSSNLDLFLEQLRARLGRQPVQGIDIVAEHCPEYACNHHDYGVSPSPGATQETVPVASNRRPFWLLPQPLPLTLSRGRLYHRKSLQLLSGPERIETRWWSEKEVCRDYYVARETGGSRLWVFRERGGERRWYLHGVFS